MSVEIHKAGGRFEEIGSYARAKRIGPFAVPKCMSSTISANLATAFKIKGINYSITSAC